MQKKDNNCMEPEVISMEEYLKRRREIRKKEEKKKKKMSDITAIKCLTPFDFYLSSLSWS